MKTTKIIYITLATLLLGIFIACGRLEPVSASTTAYPSEPPAYTGLPKVRPTTKVFTQFAASGVTKYEASGAISYNAARATPIRLQGELGTMKTDQPEEVALGTIIVSPPTPAAPYGFLRKVTNVIENLDGTVTIETAEATLQEAIAGSDLKKEDLKTTSFKVPVDVVMMPKGNQVISPYTSNSALKPQWDIDIVQLPEDLCKQYQQPIIDNAKINFKPCVKARIWATLDVDLGWWWIFPYLAGFGTKLNGYASVALSTNVNTLQVASPMIGLDIPIDVQANFQIASWLAPPIVFWLGPIPVVLTPQIDLAVDLGKLSLGIEAKATASVSSALTNFQFSLGSDPSPLQYGFYCGNTINAGYWGCKGINNIPQKFDSMVNQIKNWSPLGNPIRTNFGVDINFNIAYQATAKLSGAISLYGVLGMMGTIEPYIQPAINVNVTPYSGGGIRTSVSGKATVGVNGSLDAFVNLLFLQQRFEVAKFPNLIPKQTFTLFQSCWDNISSIPCG